MSGTAYTNSSSEYRIDQKLISIAPGGEICLGSFEEEKLHYLYEADYEYMDFNKTRKELNPFSFVTTYKVGEGNYKVHRTKFFTSKYIVSRINPNGNVNASMRKVLSSDESLFNQPWYVLTVWNTSTGYYFSDSVNIISDGYLYDYN